MLTPDGTTNPSELPSPATYSGVTCDCTGGLCLGRGNSPSSLFATVQADVLVTLDAELARSVEGIVSTASIDALG